jgi:rRNA maturation endonuclease Nob1
MAIDFKILYCIECEKSVIYKNNEICPFCGSDETVIQTPITNNPINYYDAMQIEKDNYRK